jgi:hypothetical protein
MHANLVRLTLRTPLAATVLEVADRFLFLGVNRDNGLSIGRSLSRVLADMAKLRTPVGIGAAFPGFVGRWQSVPAEFRAEIMTQVYEPLLQILILSGRRGQKAEPQRWTSRKVAAPAAA